MHNQLRNPNFYILVVTDAVLFAASLFLAYTVRFSIVLPNGVYREILSILPWCVLVKVVTFFFMGAYRGMWRYTSLPDIQRLLESSLVASLILIAGMTFVTRFHGYPRSVFIADSIFTFLLTGGARTAIRVLHAPGARLFGFRALRGKATVYRRRVALIGAGDTAEAIIREVKHSGRSIYKIVCCLDDDADKQHRDLLGIPVCGPIAQLQHYADKYDVDELLIAMPSVSGERLRAIVTMCEQSGRPFRTLPSLTSLIDGKVTIDSLRQVNFEDLLGRPPVRMDMVGIGHYLTGKVVAVTGAGGSIGSEICRQIIRFNPGRLILIEGSEYNLYRMEMELRTERKFTRVSPAMGRVQDQALLGRIFAHHRPQVVFHAAACKHVPIVELNPWEAVYNNIVGSHVVMNLCEEHGVERAVFISTDKAVRPTNVMGASKRVVEILMQSRPSGRTRFMAVRFGNVLGSSGSVIPLFQSQIRAGGPVTVTHPEMTRYFMTIPEACQLVLQAGAQGTGGEIFIVEMGTPVKIADMARDLIRLSGKEPDRDIAITYTGLRPGEKLYEELITHGEGIVATEHEKLMVLRRNGHGVPRAEVLAQLEQLLRDAATYDAGRIKATLNRMVPEYVPSDSASVLCPVAGQAEPVVTSLAT